MFEDRLRRRLRRWQENHQRTGREDDVLLGRDPRIRIDNAHRDAQTISARQTGSQLAQGQEVYRAEGKYLLIERPLVTVFPSAASLLADWQDHSARDATRQETSSTSSLANGSNRGVDQAPQRDAKDLEIACDPHQTTIRQFQTHFPDRALFLDLETCGLAGAAIFLAGLIRSHQGQMVLTQLWARNYAEEAAVIGALGEIVRTSRVLVTFNGKSFDWPQVRDRTTRYAAAAGTLPELIHFDLLHHSRRRFGRQFGDCRLQTLELHLCGRRRVGDIPGREIPRVYAEYVRTGNARLVEPILHHNALDLVTLWQLALRIGR